MSEELFEKGAKLAKQQKHEEAMKFYTKALELDPKNIRALIAKGWTLDFAGFSNKDIFVFLDKAIEFDPKCVDALLNKGFILDRTGLYKKANQCFDKVLEIDPKNVRAIYSKGVALLSLKK